MLPEFYKMLIDQSSLGYSCHKIIYNQIGYPVDYRFIEVNDTYKKMMGLVKNNIVEKTISEVMPEIVDTTFDWIAFFDDVANGTNKEMEYYVEPLRRWYKVKSFLIEKDYIVTSYVDITDCITKEHVLIEEKSQNFSALDKFHKLFDNNPALMAITDLVSHQFKEVNESFCEKLGFKKSEIIGKTVQELDIFQEPEKQLDVAKALRENGKIKDIELLVKSKTGQLMTGLFSGEIIDNQLEKSFLTVMTDITEIKRNERLLVEAKRKAEAANVAKSQFLANMSHEIRTPINGALGMLSLLEYTDLTKEQLSYVNTAKTSSELLLYLINDILDISKIEAGKMNLELRAFDIRALLEDVVSSFSASAENKKIKLISTIDLSIPKLINGDMVRLRQVLNNLLSNAVKFTMYGAIKIEVTSKPCESENEIMLFFRVSDTGIGMTTETSNMIFKPFVQGDSSITRKYGGTGLGLAISYELVNLMRGELVVRSEKDVGSTFEFTAIYEKVTSDVNSNNPQSIINSNMIKTLPIHSVNWLESASQLKLLIVEDNVINQKVVMKMLQKKGYVCDLAVNGELAFTMWLEHRYDLILMDCQMPVLDGYDATRKIRAAEEETQHTKIVAMTAYAMEGDRDKCLNAGMDEYLEKPIDFVKLLGIIENLIAERMAL